MHDLIIEFYSEEIPAGVQEWAASKIDKKIKEDFKEANLSYMHSKFYWLVVGWGRKCEIYQLCWRT